MAHDLYLVRWRDAFYSLDDDPFEDYIVESVGWGDPEEPGLFLILYKERTPDAMRGRTCIPRESVQGQPVPLREADNSQTITFPVVA